MAIRNIRIDDDEILKKRSREIDKPDDRLIELIADMKETMYEKNGVGIAAPQVGVLKRVIVVDIGEGPVVLINPVILSSSGKKTDIEGCLSVSKYMGKIERPAKLKIVGLDENFKAVEYDAKDLFARAICHEIDHIDGILITDRASELIEKKEADD